LRSLIRRLPVPGFLQPATSADDDSTLDTKTPTYEEIGEPFGSPNYGTVAPQNQYELRRATFAVSPPTSSKLDASGGDAVVYSDTTTTLVDNELYGVQRPTVTSSNDADDVTDFTLIDNDLYEREGQGQGRTSSGSADYECTLVDNDLYR